MKKILVLIATITLIISSGLYSFAGTVEGIKSDSIEITIEDASKAIDLLKRNPECLNINSKEVDLNQIYMGQEIRPMGYFDGEIKMIPGLAYFPIYSKSQVIGIYQVVMFEDGNKSVMFSKFFADKLNKISVEEVNNYNYILGLNDEVEIIKKGKKDTVLRNVKTELLKIDLSQVEKTRGSTDYKVLNVNSFYQGDNGYCWASVVSALGYYKTGTVKLPNKVCDIMNIGYDDGGTLAQIKKALSKIYGISSFDSYTGLSDSRLVTEIDADRPFGMALKESGGLGHIVTAKGYNVASSQVYAIVGDSNNSSMTANKVIGHYGAQYGYWITIRNTNGNIVTKLFKSFGNVYLYN